jgi:serine phosphatase RsbU (regulator of sigma subunit)/anti-sigma regulatory factor (Ser/Thr protein kinase)
MSAEVGASRPALLRLTIPCELAEVRPAAQEVAAFLAAQGCNTDEMSSCGIALAEACNNAISYAPSAARSSPVRIEVLVTAEAVEVRITDHTLGFDWPAEIGLPEAGSESGRGLFIIHSVSDRAGYLRGQDHNVLYFRLARTSRAAPRPEPPLTPLTEQLVEELSSCYESLAAIFRHSAATHEGTQLQTFARQLLADLQRIVRADWFALRLVSTTGSSLEVFAASESASDFEPVSLEDEGLAAHAPEFQAVTSRRPVWFNDAATSGLVNPILSTDTVLGTLTLGKQGNGSGILGSSVFNASQTNIISTLTDFLAIQLLKARSHESQLAAHATARELEIAEGIQRSLLLQELPQLSNIQIAAHCANARQVGGDFFDALDAGDDALLLVIADVMGKGIPAALFAATLRTALRSAPELFRQPAALLTRANQLLHTELSAVDMFITAQLALVDAKANRVTVASAGHPPLLLWHAGTTTCQAISPEGLPLGVRFDTQFEETRLVLGPQFTLLLNTDGLSDVINPSGNRYGQSALEQWFATTAYNGHGAAVLRDSLVTELESFRGESALADDQTFLIATRHPKT